MAYCHNCGKKLEKLIKYCGSCGTKRKGTEESKKTKVIHQSSKKNKSGLGLCLFAGFLIYLLLNFWALGQVEIDTSASSMLNSISNFNFQTGLTKTELDSEIRINNPTIIPVLITEVSYDLNYGDAVMGNGGTGFIFIMPKSYIDTPINFELSHMNTGRAALEGIVNIFQKEKKSLKMDFYAGCGPIKIPVGEL